MKSKVPFFIIMSENLPLDIHSHQLRAHIFLMSVLLQKKPIEKYSFCKMCNNWKYNFKAYSYSVC